MMHEEAHFISQQGDKIIILMPILRNMVNISCDILYYVSCIMTYT